MKWFARYVISGLGGLLVACLLLLGMGAAAQSSDTTILRPDVHKMLHAAQEAMGVKDWDKALNLTNEALGLQQLSVYEKNTILRNRAAVANALKNWDLTIDSLEAVIENAGMAPNERWLVLEALIGAAQQKKDLSRLAKWAQIYVDDKGPKPIIHTVLVQTLAAMGEHHRVVAEMEKRAEADERSGVKTGQQELRLMAVSYKQLKDDAGYMRTIKRLTALYPSKEYWADLIVRLANQPGLNPRMELDLYRLLEETGNLDDQDLYMDMANQALKAGLPAEALRILTKGLEQGVLGKGAQAPTQRQFLAEVQKKAREDDSSFVQLEKSAKEGNHWASIGEVYLSRQNWSAAHEAFAKALSLGRVRREHELRLHDAIALYKSGQKDAAAQQLAQVQGDPWAVEIASLWRLLMR